MPARLAYAKACGIKTSPTEKPAIASRRSVSVVGRPQRRNGKNFCQLMRLLTRPPHLIRLNRSRACAGPVQYLTARNKRRKVGFESAEHRAGERGCDLVRASYRLG